LRKLRNIPRTETGFRIRGRSKELARELRSKEVLQRRRKFQQEMMPVLEGNFLASLASILYTEVFIGLRSTDKSGCHIVQHARCDVYNLLKCDAL
jgi:hypothetical protein